MINTRCGTVVKDFDWEAKTRIRGEYNVLFGDKGNGIVFGFSANFGNVLGGAKRRPKYFQKMIKHFRKIILQNISHKEAKHFQK